MPISNFVEFATDKIYPDVLESHLDTNYVEGDFFGADESTMDFTKIGWLISCRDSMVRKGTWTQSVDDIVNRIFSLEEPGDSGTIKNYRTLSNGNFNLLQQIVFDNRNNKDFAFSYSFIDEFDDAMDMLYDKQDQNQMSAAEMIVEFSLNKAAIVLSESRIGSASTESIPSNRFSILMYAMQKASSESISIPDGTGYAAKTLNVIMSKNSGNLSYNDLLFRNPMSQAEAAYPKNEISRIVSYLGNEPLKNYIGDIVSLVPDSNENEEIMSALISSSAGSTGFGLSQVSFDTDNYITLTENHQANQGYSPLFFYISKRKSGCLHEVLEALSEVFSPLSLVLTTSSKDGFSPLSLAAHYLEISDGRWVDNDLLAFVKNSIEPVSSLDIDIYRKAAILGSVRDVTSGASSNAFGTLNNIFEKINKYNLEWWQSQGGIEGATIDDFESIYNGLIEELWPEMTYSTYKIWMYEYGKEIG